jgi:hypothetical protein
MSLSLSGLYLWWPRKIFRFRMAAQAARTNYDLHRTVGFWSSLVMFLFAVTGVNLHIQTGGALFDMMDAKASAVNLPGHGTTADGMLRAASEAVPGARPMRISFWDDKRPVLVQMRFPEDHTPAGRTNGHLEPADRQRPDGGEQPDRAHCLHSAGAMESRDPYRNGVRHAVTHRGIGLQPVAKRVGGQRFDDLGEPQGGRRPWPSNCRCPAWARRSFCVVRPRAKVAR